MAHWRDVLPAGWMLEVSYEALVDDFEHQARRIVAHCGLEWDEACLAFHANERRGQNSQLCAGAHSRSTAARSPGGAATSPTLVRSSPRSSASNQAPARPLSETASRSRVRGARGDASSRGEVVTSDTRRQTSARWLIVGRQLKPRQLPLAGPREVQEMGHERRKRVLDALHIGRGARSTIQQDEPPQRQRARRHRQRDPRLFTHAAEDRSRARDARAASSPARPDEPGSAPRRSRGTACRP